MKHLLLAAATMLAPMAVQAADLVKKTSAHDVPTTVDRLVDAVENAGARVFARVDHAAGAKTVGADLRPTEMLMFGNPKIGTAAMQAAQTAGLDLPLRVVVLEEADGTVTLAYHAPSFLAETHGIPTDAEFLTRMGKALDALTTAAVSN